MQGVSYSEQDLNGILALFNQGEPLDGISEAYSTSTDAITQLFRIKSKAIPEVWNQERSKAYQSQHYHDNKPKYRRIARKAIAKKKMWESLRPVGYRMGEIKKEDGCICVHIEDGRILDVGENTTARNVIHMDDLEMSFRKHIREAMSFKPYRNLPPSVSFSKENGKTLVIRFDKVKGDAMKKYMHDFIDLYWQYLNHEREMQFDLYPVAISI